VVWAAGVPAKLGRNNVCINQRISNRQKNRAVAVSPRSNRAVAPCNTPPPKKRVVARSRDNLS